MGERVFQGANQINLDAKGRMAVPTRARDPLTQGGTVKLVLTAHPDACLLLYPAPAWEPIRAQVMSFPSLDRQASLWKRLLVGFAVPLVLGALSWKLVRDRSFQSATGMLYLIVVFTLAGEIMARGLFLTGLQ